MGELTGLLGYFMAHKEDFLLLIGNIVVAASIIVGLTPSKVDNEVLDKILNILARFSLIKRDEIIKEKNK